MIALGIDPDVKDLAFGLWDENGPLDAAVVHVTGRKVGNSAVRMAQQLFTSLIHASYWFRQSISRIEVVAIEGQQKDKRRARPKDLFTLAHVTGAALHWTVSHWPEASIYVPTPREWKGGVAKHAHQARLYHDLGWGYTIIGSGDNRYARPSGLTPSKFKYITPGQWKHVGDALLLARWAYNKAKE